MPPFPNGSSELNINSVARQIVQRIQKNVINEDLVQHSLQKCFEKKFLERRARYQAAAHMSDGLSSDSEIESDSEMIKLPAGSFRIPIGYSKLPMKFFEASTENFKIPTQPFHEANQFSWAPMQQLPHIFYPLHQMCRMYMHFHPLMLPQPVVFPQPQVNMPTYYWRPWQSSCHKRQLEQSYEDIPSAKRQKRQL